MIATRLALAAALATTPLVAAPARAEVGVTVLYGGFTYRAGAGTAYDGTGQFWAVGTRTGPVQATFEYSSGFGLDCQIQDSIAGVMTGAVNVSFTYTRLGALAAMTWTGDFNGESFVPALLTDAPVSCAAPTTVHATVAIPMWGI